MTGSPKPSEQEHLEAALGEALSDYFASCRQRVPEFVRAHFQYPGAFKTNRHALGWDLVRAPLNLFWAPVYVCCIILGFFAKRLKLDWLAALFNKTPSGLTTSVQRHVVELIQTELITAEDLQQSIANLDEQFQPLIQAAMDEYRITRTAAADITNAVTSALVGAFAWQKFTPGAFAIGFLIAAEISHYWAVSNFFLGDTLGGIYYGLFPAEPSLELKALGVMFALTLMAIFATLSGFVSDPLQSRLGIHQRRLRRLIDSLERDLLVTKDNSYKPKDQYLARLVDMVDAIRSPFA